MSFCPTRDIHSIYLDNEMPEIYKAEYETHLKECEKCRRELEKMKALKMLLKSKSDDSDKSDADSKVFEKINSEEFMNKSFERLQMKMKYVENVKRTESEKKINLRQFIPTVAAAAAVCAAIVLPFGLKNNNAVSETTAYVPQIYNEASNVSLNNDKSVVVSGNIHQSIVSSYVKNVSESTGSYNGLSQSQNKSNEMIKEVDVFRPAFEEDKKSIKITVPEFGDIPLKIEISFPESEGTGL